MAKIQKKGERGAAANYITRTKAVRKLQISLAEFRRLCILKGIYPREPRNKKKASGGKSQNNTFYYIKDINYLLHEPILAKFRERKSFMKKIQKALGKRQTCVVEALEENEPVYTLDHIIKERYPSFMDAVRDMDDCLCHVFLFATLPVNEQIEKKHVDRCQELVAEFQNQLVMSNGLKKAFLSIKGVYYQADIKGQPVVWLVPYQFSQTVPQDVDVRVMLTFLEFYETLMSFVNFKLYADMNLPYPPKVNSYLSERGAGSLASYMNKIEQAPSTGNAVIMDKDLMKERLVTLNEKIEAIVEEDQGEQQPTVNEIFVTQERTEDARLLTGKIIFISREVPRYSVEFVLRSLGATVCWSRTSGKGSPFPEDYAGITHHIVDRPIEGLHMHANRYYVQPQWIYDCINTQTVQSESDYAPGKSLPPHLSPFAAYDNEDVIVEDDKTMEVTTDAPQEEEKVTLAKMMMSNKKRKLLERIEKSQAQKTAEASKLKAKKTKLRQKQ